MDKERPRRFWTRERQTVAWVVGVLMALGAVGLFGDLGTSNVNVDRRKVIVSTVDRGPFQEFIAITGNVQPKQTVFLESLEGGRVEEIFVDAGIEVAEGRPILRLSNTNLQQEANVREDLFYAQSDSVVNGKVEFDQQRRDFERRVTELDYEILKKNRIYQRNEVLLAEGLVPELDFELSRDEHQFLIRQRELEVASEKENEASRKAQLDQLREALERRRKDLELAREKLERLVIRAPISGQLTALDGEVGQSVMSGQRLGQVDSLGGFKVEANVDQHYLPRVEVGLEGEFDLAGNTHELRVTKVYPEVMDGRFLIDLELIGMPPEAIRRGQNLSIRLALGDVSEALRVSNGAFFQKTGGQWAFVLDGEAARRRPIKLGRRNPDYFEVVEGLEPGDRVLTSSYDAFEGYDQVTLETP